MSADSSRVSGIEAFHHRLRKAAAGPRKPRSRAALQKFGERAILLSGRPGAGQRTLDLLEQRVVHAAKGVAVAYPVGFGRIDRCKPGPLERLKRYAHTAMDELGAELDGRGDTRLIQGPDTPADAIARFQ